MNRNFFIILLGIGFLIGCSSSGQQIWYDDFHSLEDCLWMADDRIEFEVNNSDTTHTHQIEWFVRNNGDYPYSNLFILTEIITPSNTSIKDTLECYLADKQGNWLGQGISGIKETSIQAHEGFVFKQTGLYRIRIRHGMRTDSLPGICTVGLQISKPREY